MVEKYKSVYKIVLKCFEKAYSKEKQLIQLFHPHSNKKD